MSDDREVTPAADGGPLRPKPPTPLILSCFFGALGMVLIVAGIATSTEAAFLAGLVAGILSLSAALYWRSELVSAWAASKRAERS